MPLSWNEIRDRATAFAREWKDADYERGEAQNFWREFFAVFGQDRRLTSLLPEAAKKARPKRRVKAS